MGKVWGRFLSQRGKDRIYICKFPAVNVLREGTQGLTVRKI
jgi:hypothetical protein